MLDDREERPHGVRGLAVLAHHEPELPLAAVPAARALDALAEQLATRKRGLAGRKLALHVS